MKRAIVIIALAAVPVFADDIYLQGGGQITGEIVEQTKDSVTVDIGGGATITAHMANVDHIDKNVSPLQEYRARAAKIPAGDAEAWRKLARWATGEALSSQAGKAYSHVVAILPDDEEANRALGRIQVNGKWVTEEESYVSRGYVEFEGQWMTPGERQQILASRKASKQADQQANDAAILAIDAEQKAEKQQRAADTEAFRRDGLPRVGDPVNWGWGAGPSYWPSPSRNLQ